jgi:hypothetical protein
MNLEKQKKKLKIGKVRLKEKALILANLCK